MVQRGAGTGGGSLAPGPRLQTGRVVMAIGAGKLASPASGRARHFKCAARLQRCCCAHQGVCPRAKR